MSEAQETREVALTDVVLRTFELNGLFLAAADRLARPAGLTAAWWQVLGAVLAEPLTVSGVARSMGLSRQSVQRTADLLVENELARFLPNPSHKRAKLLEPSEKGWQRVRSIHDRQRVWARSVAGDLDRSELRATLEVMDRLVAGLVREAEASGEAPARGGGLREGDAGRRPASAPYAA